jgi:hypothetical protein
VNPPEATAGLCLGYLAVATLLKRIISGLFLPGPLLHSGMLYLTIVFELPWAGQVLAMGIGPVMLLAALLLTCVAAAIGFRGQSVGSQAAAGFSHGGYLTCIKSGP